MTDLQILISYSNLKTLYNQLEIWNDKKPTKEVETLLKYITEIDTTFRQLEKELITSLQRSRALEIEVLKLTQENKELTEINDKLKSGL